MSAFQNDFSFYFKTAPQIVNGISLADLLYGKHGQAQKHDGEWNQELQSLNQGLPGHKGSPCHFRLFTLQNAHDQYQRNAVNTFF